MCVWSKINTSYIPCPLLSWPYQTGPGLAPSMFPQGEEGRPGRDGRGRSQGGRQVLGRQEGLRHQGTRRGIGKNRGIHGNFPGKRIVKYL